MKDPRTHQSTPKQNIIQLVESYASLSAAKGKGDKICCKCKVGVLTSFTSKCGE